ncbi:GNAT family N-acetyltransferase [Clostridium hydrogenum]|uniref:GNAT family N-acetyltransferase n=1 Tax=Clostridium hydrogenum TaxID=2855764 RepID=UPI001F234762|nr:GNAT family N-acetyltransferase [Clostridium hydrogenum]
MKNNGTALLETDRLRLRRFTTTDIEQSFINWASDSNSSKYIAYYPHKNKSDTENMINQWIQSYENKCTYIWAIEVKETGEVIGNISASVPFAALEICEIAYMLGSSWWHKGYALEALKKVLDYLFSHEDFYMVEAKYNITNKASGKLLHKVGMKQDGILRHRRIDKESGERNDLAICSLLKSEYANESKLS